MNIRAAYRHLRQRRLARVLVPILALTIFPVSAAAQTIVMKVPVSQTLTSCTGELVTITGEQTIGSHIGTDSAGGLHVKLSVENRGLKGIGMISGVRYVGLDTTESETQIPKGATEATVVHNLSLIRQGEDGTLPVGDDLRLKELFHMTVNAQGVPTAFQYKFENDCS